ncbi:hypothetical protein SERLA73DRAFT_65124, partial [Serpula lacrymans var. lacrymans S7.3]
GQSSLHGAFLWRQINKVVELKKNWCALGDLSFINLLQCIRLSCAWNDTTIMTDSQSGVGTNYSESDFDVFNKQCLQYLSVHHPQDLGNFKDAPIIVCKKVLCDAINYKKVQSFARSTNQDFLVYHSKDVMKKKPLSEDVQQFIWDHIGASITHDSLGKIPLILGMRVMVTENVATFCNVVNGAEGILQDIKFSVDEQNCRYTECAYVKIEGANLQSPSLPIDVVPILPSPTRFTYSPKITAEEHASHTSAKSCNIVRTQLPLLPAYAYTNYKVQGRSLKKVILDLAGCRFLQNVYVMLSHATSLAGVAILRTFKSVRTNQHIGQEFREEFNCLQVLDEETKTLYLAQYASL